MSKLWPSTFFWAPSIDLVSQGCSICSPGFMPSFSMSPLMRSEPKMRISSSSSDR